MVMAVGRFKEFVDQGQKPRGNIIPERMAVRDHALFFFLEERHRRLAYYV